QLSQLTFVAGVTGGLDELSIQVSDGQAASAVGYLHVRAATPAPSDFNGDARSDLLLLNDTSHGLYVCLMNGAAIGANGLSFTIDAASDWHYQGLGDFDGDGKSDIMLMNDVTHGIYVCEMNGTGLAAGGSSFNVNAAAGWHFQDLADFNGDGKTDIL